MENQGMSFAQLYQRALVNPTDVPLKDFEQLLARYPYSQPIHFAFERRKFLLDEENTRLGSKAILLAINANRLAEYVQLPVEEIPMVEVEDDDYVPFEDLEINTEESHDFVEEDGEEQEEGVEGGGNQDFSHKQTLESLLQEGIAGGDYFTIHGGKTDIEEQSGSEVEEEVRENEQKEENISLYNDELMPYSFRWWLHKTRLEYADSYQPFASPRLPTTNKSSFDSEELDRVILDQQIREHIIHLQSPEDKLSEEVKQRESAVDKPNKVTEVIERFIREEPQIQPPPPENLNVENKARKSSEEQFNFVTETLANIYADQAMYVKAIEVYKKLILRFPEKKSYFASRIKELEEKLY